VIGWLEHSGDATHLGTEALLQMALLGWIDPIGAHD
jgi:hypothetical protein